MAVVSVWFSSDRKASIRDSTPSVLSAITGADCANFAITEAFPGSDRNRLPVRVLP